mgnify:CR=1 FL=1
MLSVASVKSASGAAEYFAKDDKHPADYYLGDGGEGGGAGGEGGPDSGAGGDGPGSGGGGADKSGDAGVGAGDAARGSANDNPETGWGGKGAEMLGLSGEVTKNAFEKILNGELPNGEKVGQTENRRSGMDLTFSMPKSASILALVSGDERILAAHWSAVRETMTWVESKFAEGRTYERTKSGEAIQTGNLVYGMFAHDTSRALDPQGHIHVVIANLTQMANGAWQALLGDHRGAARGHVLRQVYRNSDLADVEGTLLFREIIPVRISGDDDFPLAVRILAQVEGILIHLMRRVRHQVAMPQQGRRGAQELGLIGSRVQT